MYLSRLRLNPTRRDARRLVGSPQAMHAAVMGSHHPESSSNPAGRVLWRLDNYASHDLQLYVVSPSRPDFTGLLEQAGWPTQISWDTTNYAAFLANIDDGQSWSYRLTANPVRVLARDSASVTGRGKVSPHLTVGQQQAWLAKHSHTWGFSLPADDNFGVETEVRERHTASFGRQDPSEAGRRASVSLTRATFKGVLTVTDPEALRSALTLGMGRAKAYGCGLMTLAPPPR